MEKIELKNSRGKVFFKSWYDVTSNQIVAEWIGFVTLQNVKEACTEGLKLLKDTSCPFLLNSNEELEGSWDEANEWIAETWMPQALNYGLKRFAHIVSDDIFVEISAEEMVSRTSKYNFEMRMFKQRHEAREWLRAEADVVL